MRMQQDMSAARHNAAMTFSALIAIVDRGRRTVIRRTIPPAAARSRDMNECRPWDMAIIQRPIVK